MAAARIVSPKRAGVSGSTAAAHIIPVRRTGVCRAGALADVVRLSGTRIVIGSRAYIDVFRDARVYCSGSLTVVDCRGLASVRGKTADILRARRITCSTLIESVDRAPWQWVTAGASDAYNSCD